MGLLATASVAIDGSKFKAVNNRDKNFTRAKVERRRAQLEESVARYLSQLDTADRQEPTDALAAKVTRLTEKLTKLTEEMGKLGVYEKQMLASPDQQISLTVSRSMATSGRGSGVVGYNVQVAVDTEHHLIVAHEVTNSGSDRAQLANMAKQVLKTETLEAVADRGYFSSPEILACHEAGITVTLPKPQTSGAKSEGRFVSRTLCICQGTMPIAVQLGSDCRIAIPTKKTARCCGVTGPPPVKIVRSNRNARPGPSGGLRDGSMNICLRPCSSALMQTHKPAPASRDSRASVRHDEGTYGSDTLPHQDASKSSCRDGSLGPGLQSDTGHEHRRDQAVDGCDRGLRPNSSWLLTDLPGRDVFTRPRPKADIRASRRALCDLTTALIRVRAPAARGRAPWSA